MKLTNKQQTKRNGFSLIILIALIISIAQAASAIELRVLPLAGELNRCVAGLPLTAGPNAGQTAGNGDDCVLQTGAHTLPATAVVTIPNLTIRATSNVTNVIAGGFPAFRVLQPGVTFGGDGNEGFQITGGNAGIAVTGAATRDITIEHLYINTNGVGVVFLNLPQFDGLDIKDSELRNNPAGGLLFLPTVGPVRDIRLTDSEFDANGFNAVTFINTGSLDDVAINRNSIRGSAFNGVQVAPTVTNVSDFGVEYNRIEGNGFGVPGPGGSGLFFGNSGQAEVYINSNRDGNVGITGNRCAAIIFDGAGSFIGPFLGGGVTDVEAQISDNTINNNGVGISCPAIVFLNGSDVEDLEMTGNRVKLNGGGGVFMANGQDFKDGLVKDNRFENNGTATVSPMGLLGSGFAVFAGNDVTDHLFEGNYAKGNYYHGVFLGTLGGKVENLVFDQEHYEQNGLGIPSAMGLIAAGLEVSSSDDVKNVEMRDSKINRNGGAGVYLDATAFSLVQLGLMPVPAPADVHNISLYRNEFDFNGNSAPSGAGSGVFMLGDNVQEVLSEDNQATSNDDHGLFISALDDGDDILVTNGYYNGNDSNIDTVGAGLFFEATNDLRDVTINGAEVKENEHGIYLNIKGQNGTNLNISGNMGCDNNGSGIRIKANDDINSTVVENNAVYGNGTNLNFQVNDAGGITQSNNNLNICELPELSPTDGETFNAAVQSASAPVTLSVTPLGNGAFQFRAMNATSLRAMTLDIISTGGERMFHTRSTTGTILAHGLSDAGQPLANGVYFYAVTLEKADGTIERIVKKVMILR